MIGLLSLVLIFSLCTSFFSLGCICGFFAVFLFEGLLPIRDTDKLLLSFLALADLFRLRLDCDLPKEALRGDLFFSLPRLELGGLRLSALTPSFYLDL